MAETAKKVGASPYCGHVDDPWWRQKGSGVPKNNWPIYEDFRNFLYLTWQHLDLPEPTKVQYDLARFLQHGPRRGVIEAFRGEGKSMVASAFVVWLLMRDPDIKIEVISGSKDRSDSFSTFTKRLIGEMPVVSHLKPRQGCRDSNIQFDVAPAKASHSPSVKSVGITGAITGSRADVIIPDDVEMQNNSDTQTKREQLHQRVKELDSVIKPDGRIIYLGTPHTEQSLYNELAVRGYQVRIWPARYPDDERREKYGNALAPMIANELDRGEVKVGDPTDPERFTDMDLRERELSHGTVDFALQFMLDTSLSDEEKYPLKLQDLVVTNVDPDLAPSKVMWRRDPQLYMKDLPNVGLHNDCFYRASWESDDKFPYEGAVMVIDPSGRGQDETAYAVVKMLNGTQFVTAMGGFQDGYADKTLRRLSEIARDQQVNYVWFEDNFGDGMFGQLLKPYLMDIYPVTIEGDRNSTTKEWRIIDTLEPVMRQHRLVVDEDVIWDDYKNVPESAGKEHAPKYRLFYQMARICKEKGALAQDDRLDALAMAVGYWVNAMARHQQQAADERKARWLEEELTAHMDNQLTDTTRGGPGRRGGLTWM